LSKEIAQTVGNKKFGLLLALLLALAVFATVGSHWQSAKATVTQGSYQVQGPYTAATNGCTTPAAAVVQVGTTLDYCVNAIADAAVVNPLQVTFTVPSQLQITSVVQIAGSAPQPACTISGAFGGNTVVCTYTGLSGTSTWQLKIVTIAVNRGILPAGAGNTTGGPAGSVSALLDDPSNGNAFATNNTAAITIQGALLAITKVHAPASPANGANVTYTLTVTNPAPGDGTGAAALNVHILDTIDSSVYASIQAVSAAGGTVNTCTPSTFPSSIFTVDCNIGTLAIGATATATITATLITIPAPAAGLPATTVTVNDVATATATNSPTATSNTDSFVVSGAAGAALPLLCEGLFQVDAFGHLMLGPVDPNPSGTAGVDMPCTTAAPRDVDNNVVGFDHRVCFVQEPGTIFPGPDAIQPPNTASPTGSTRWRIDTVSGTSNVQGQVLLVLSPTNTAGFANGGSLDCVRWYSTAPGEQNITLVDDHGQVVADWADGPSNGADQSEIFSTESCGVTPQVEAALFLLSEIACDPITAFTPLVKEWNLLIPTTITATALVNPVLIQPANLDQSVSLAANPNVGAILDPSAGMLVGTSKTFFENVLATHTNAFGTNVYLGIGALVTFTHTGTCGSFTLTDPLTFLNPTSVLPASFVTNSDGSVTSSTSVTVESVGKSIPFTFSTAGSTDCSGFAGSTNGVSITVTYANFLGSQNPVIPTETIQVTFVSQIPVKQVLLAWAGQRVLLEHDWRIPPGDGSPLGVCPFGPGTDIRYEKAAEGPGNFVPGLGINTSTLAPDQVEVTLSGDNSQINGKAGEGDAPDDPQGACISRAIYESEDQGEVDIEVFDESGSFGETKVAFVIYYMKFNQVAVSLVTQDYKPTHNGSSLLGIFSDWATGTTPTGPNPWDATKDAANNTADWNVSRDLLVRGRVSGWFLNSDPSGRARDATDPANVLPADRWVMPDDWVNIAGGAALANSFRPSYDLMFAPNNVSGLSLASPTGTLANILTLTIATPAGGAATSTTVFYVASAANLTVGQIIVVGTTPVTITAIAGNKITVTALGAAPAAFTPVLLSLGIPFEGPYSLIDIPGFSTLTGIGAALSNLGTAALFRDTTQGDGVVDWWDAPMPPANITVRIRGTGFIHQVFKSTVYYLGTPLSTAQLYPNPYYVSNIPESPYLPAVAAGGGFLWNSWGNDGPNTIGCLTSSFNPCNGGQGVYTFWQSLLLPGPNTSGVDSMGAGSDSSLSAADLAELTFIRNVAYADPSISRTMVVFSDNHGEFMVAANGDFKTDLTACASNALAGGKLCKPGDKVGVGSISAVADYPDFKKHGPVASNTATVNWTWGGFKDVTIEPGSTDQFRFVVFHGLDRDGFCDIGGATGGIGVSLHPVLSGAPNDTFTFVDSNGVTHTTPPELIDFLIDSGEGIVLNNSGGTVNDGKQFATGVPTFDVAARKALGLLTFPLDAPAMPAGTADECQAFIQVSNSLLGIMDVLVVAHNDEGNEGFEKIIDLTGTTSYTLNFRWSLITWAGADGIPVADALKGGASTKNPGGNDISASVTAVYGWNASGQSWLGYFPTGVNVPGANNLTSLSTGQAYWIAITGPGSVTWTVTTNVGG
jgi:Domain of unknown function DUF11